MHLSNVMWAWQLGAAGWLLVLICGIFYTKKIYVANSFRISY